MDLLKIRMEKALSILGDKYPDVLTVLQYQTPLAGCILRKLCPAGGSLSERSYPDYYL